MEFCAKIPINRDIAKKWKLCSKQLDKYVSLTFQTSKLLNFLEIQWRISSAPFLIKGEKPPTTFFVGEALGEFSEGTSSQLTLQNSRTFFCRRWTCREVTTSLLAADLPVNPIKWAPCMRRHRLPTHRITQLPFSHDSVNLDVYAGIWLATAVVASVCVLNFDYSQKAVKTNVAYIPTPFMELKNSVKLFSDRETKISSLYFSHCGQFGKWNFSKVPNGPSEMATERYTWVKGVLETCKFKQPARL